MEITKKEVVPERVSIHYELKLDNQILLHYTYTVYENGGFDYLDRTGWEWDSKQDDDIFNGLPETEQQAILDFIEEEVNR